MLRRAVRRALPVLLLATLGGAQDEGSGRKAFLGALILPGAGDPIEDGALLVRYGRVTSVGSRWAGEIPDDAEIVELAGKVIVPGLVNAHGHVGGTVGLESGADLHSDEIVADQLARYARYGVTSVFSLGGDRGPGLRAASRRESFDVDRARLFVAGPVIDAETPAEAGRQVELAAGLGVDLIKIRVDDFFDTREKMPPHVFRAVIESAHERGLRVAAHVYELEDAKALVEAGVDLLAHSVRDRDVDDELIALMREREVCLCPTLTRELSVFAYAQRPAFFDDPFFLRDADPAVVAALQDPERQRAVADDPATERAREGLEVARRNLARLADAGVRIAFGTDTGPPGRFQGYFEHVELEMMVEAGLTPAQALRAATVDAARCFGHEGRVGELEPGAWADFVVLSADPTEDIRNLRRIESVWIAGRPVAGP